jgi:hypothetical protein
VIVTDGTHLMSSDGNLVELHAFAKRLGLKPGWFQGHARHLHYDLTTGRMSRKAVYLGAKVVLTRELVRL